MTCCQVQPKCTRTTVSSPRPGEQPGRVEYPRGLDHTPPCVDEAVLGSEAGISGRFPQRHLAKVNGVVAELVEEVTSHSLE